MIKWKFIFMLSWSLYVYGNALSSLYFAWRENFHALSSHFPPTPSLSSESGLRSHWHRDGDQRHFSYWGAWAQARSSCSCTGACRHRVWRNMSAWCRGFGPVHRTVHPGDSTQTHAVSVVYWHQILSGDPFTGGDGSWVPVTTVSGERSCSLVRVLRGTSLFLLWCKSLFNCFYFGIHSTHVLLQ